MEGLFPMWVVLVSSILLVTLAGCKGPEEDRFDLLDRAVARLDTLPYAKWERGEAKVGVLAWDRARAWEGVNLFPSCPVMRARAVAMDGRVLHTWHYPLGGEDGWQHVEPGPRGSLLVVVKDRALLSLDWSSKPRWIYRAGVHHDVAVREDGAVLVLTRQEEVVRHPAGEVPMLVDHVVELGPDGRPTKDTRLIDTFVHLVPETRVRAIQAFLAGRHPDGRVHGRRDVLNVMHTNTLEIVPRAVPAVGIRAGSWLLCARDLDTIAVVDPATMALVWSWGPGVLDRPHQPTFLPSGHILVFDNGPHRGYSRVIEVDPVTREIVWAYGDEGAARFFSRTRGGVQLLPNGDLLITESDRGRAFEITRAGRVVWDYGNPDSGLVARRGEVAPVYRLIRMPIEGYRAWAGGAREGG